MSDLHHRSTLDDAFCEWLLSDHPDAKAERDWRRGTHLRQLRESAAEIAAWADRVSAEPEQHTPMARDLAGTIGPMAHASAIRAEIEEAEPDDAYVARQRAEFESHMRWDHPGLPLPRPSHRPVSGQLPAATRAGAGGGAMTPERGDRGSRARRGRDPVPAPARPRSLRGRARRRLPRRIPASRRRPGRPVEPGRPRRHRRPRPRRARGTALGTRRPRPLRRPAPRRLPRPGRPAPARPKQNPKWRQPHERHPPDPAMFAQLTRAENRMAASTSAMFARWYKQAAVYPDPVRALAWRPKRCRHDPSAAEPWQKPARSSTTCTEPPGRLRCRPEQREPEAGQ